MNVNKFQITGLICLLTIAAFGLIPFSSKDLINLIAYALLAVICIIASWLLICRETAPDGKCWLITLPIAALACFANLVLHWRLCIPFFATAIVSVCTDAALTHIKKEDNPLSPVCKIYLSGMIAIILFTLIFALLGVYI